MTRDTKIGLSLAAGFLALGLLAGCARSTPPFSYDPAPPASLGNDSWQYGQYDGTPKEATRPLRECPYYNALCNAPTVKSTKPAPTTAPVATDAPRRAAPPPRATFGFTLDGQGTWQDLGGGMTSVRDTRTGETTILVDR